MTPRLRTLTVLVAAPLAVAGVAALVFREPVERAIVLGAARSATGLAIDADRIDHDGGTYAVTNLRVRTAGGGAVLEAPEATVRIAGRHVAVALTRPHVTVIADGYGGYALARLRAAASRGGARDGDATVTFADGTLDVAAGAMPSPVLALRDVRGTLDLRASGVAYTADMALDDGGARYPIAARPEPAPSGGAPVETWRAATLPLHALAAYCAGAPLASGAGELRDVAYVADARTGSAHLAGGAIAVGAHALAGLHGAVAFGGEGVGSKQLAGTIDGMPFTAAGEVHDLGPSAAWLREGSPDLRALGRLLANVAGEPRVRSVRLEAEAPGLAYAQYAMASDHGPLAVSVLAANPAEATLRFGTAIAQDHVVSGGERTSAMGVRTHAVAGVNGDYFDIGRTYQPQGMLVRDGRLVRGPTDRAALVIDRSNRVTIAQFALHGSVRTRAGTLPVTEFNDWPPGRVAVVTPAYGKLLPAAPDRTFVALAPEGGDRYRVTSAGPVTAAMPPAFGYAMGPLEHAPPPKPGETVELDYGLTPDVPNAVAGIGGGPILVRGGRPYDDPHAPAPDEKNYRWPVIAVAATPNDRLLLVAVDGRHPERSIGMTRPEFTTVLRRLGAADAMALDSGGSVTMVARAPGDADVTVRNVPSDNSAERWVSDALYVYSTAPAQTLVPPAAAATPVPEARPAP